MFVIYVFNLKLMALKKPSVHAIDIMNKRMVGMGWCSLFFFFVSESLVSLFDEGELNTLLWEE